MAEVFVSYAHADRDLARAISEHLAEAGAEVWWDRELIAGDDFDEKILEQASAAQCMVIIWTPNSVTSRYVRDEAQIAAERGRIVPIAITGVQPPLGFRRFHLIELRPAGIDAEFVRILVRAVEERLGRTLRRPVNLESAPTTEAPQSPEPEYAALPLTAAYSALAVGNECVWLGDWQQIEAWDFDNKILLGANRATVEMLFSMPLGDDCICCGSAIGYHAPDTIRVDRWKFAHSLDRAREEYREAQDYRPMPQDPSRQEYIDSARKRSIDSERVFTTYSWVLGPVALSEDGKQAAVVVNDPEKQIQVWNTSSGQPSRNALPLENFPDELMFLRGGAELVTVERPKAGGSSRISIWNVDSGQRTTEYELEWVTVNSISRAHRDNQIVLGLDQSVVFLNVRGGNIETRVEIQSRPVRNCSFDPQSGSIGVLTDKELIVIDSANVGHIERISHGYAKGVRCDLRGNRMAAIVTDEKDKSALVLWRPNVRAVVVPA